MLATASSAAADAIADRLRRTDHAVAGAPAVTWRDGADEVLLHLESLTVTDAEGWLVCALELETPAEGRSRVRFAFHTSVNGLGDRVRACATLCDAPSAARPALRVGRRGHAVGGAAEMRWLALVGCCLALAACGGDARVTPRNSTVPVLVYRDVAGTDFAAQMERLRDAGYETISLPAFIRFLRGDRVSLPARPFLLTFDDGRADLLTDADPVLREAGFDAVLFADVGGVEGARPGYLRWEQIRDLQRSGRWDIQMESGSGKFLMQLRPEAHGRRARSTPIAEPRRSSAAGASGSSGTSRGASASSSSASPATGRWRLRRPTATTARRERTTPRSRGCCSSGCT